VELIFRPQLGIAAAIALLGAFLVMWLHPADRRPARYVVVARNIASDAMQMAAQAAADFAAIAMGAVLIRMFGLVLFRVILPALKTRAPRIIEDLFIAAILAAWGLLWLRMAGVDLASILTTSAVLTGIVAFSMQETLGNIVGGLALQIDNSIRIGDWVRIDDVSGRVVEVNWRFTAIETRNRETVVVPNSYLMKNRFTVIGSRADAEMRWRRTVHFHVMLDAMPSDVCRVLEHAVHDAAIPNVASDIAPSAVLLDFMAGSGHYGLRYWLTDPAPDDPTDSQVSAHGHAALSRAGMRLAITQEEHLLIKGDDTWRQSQHDAEIARRLAALSNVAIFRSLTEDELRRMASHLVHAPFLAGDTMTRQGAVAHWLYLVISGDADVWSEEPDGSRSHIATLHGGNVFGEMGMMTGDPRRATVTARSDVVCYRLDKAGLQEILQARPDIAAEISHVLAQRNAELEAARAVQGHPLSRATVPADLLGRIRNFFGLD